jgi:hypothetical protein
LTTLVVNLTQTSAKIFSVSPLGGAQKIFEGAPFDAPLGEKKKCAVHRWKVI